MINPTSWRRHGVYRITLEVPLPVWRAAERESTRLGLTPSQLIRMALAQYFDVRLDESTPSGGAVPPQQ